MAIRTPQGAAGQDLPATLPVSGSVAGSPFTVTSATAVDTPNLGAGAIAVISTQNVRLRFVKPTQRQAASAVVAAAGSGYSVSDILTVVGGTGTAATFEVATVDVGGEVLTVTLDTAGAYTSPPANPAATTVAPPGGTGATLTVTYTTAKATAADFYLPLNTLKEFPVDGHILSMLAVTTTGDVFVQKLDTV